MKKIAIAVLALVVAGGIGALVFFQIWNRKAPESPEQLVSKKWEAARKSPMHTAHVGKKKIACGECHANGDGLVDLAGAEPSASASPAVMAAVDAGALSSAATSCAKCHEKQSKTSHQGGGTTTTTCTDCHAFRGGVQPEKCVDCHASPKPKAKTPLHHHAQKDLSCTTCHDLHDEKRSKLPGDCRSSGCHDGLAAVAHGKIADVGKEACATCHQPHQGKEAARTTCAQCHASGDFDKKKVLATWLAAAPRVVFTPSKHDGCATCHEAHDAKRASVKDCASCHANKKEGHADGHTGACTSCHSPHTAPRESAKTACKNCHAGVKVLGAEKSAQHQDCRSCHDPHRPASKPTDSCVGCHSKVAPKHPADAAKGTCVGCHSPHKQTAPLLSATCSSCHSKAKSEKGFHAAGKTSCTQCHKQHDFKLAAIAGTAASGPPSICAQCHQDKTSATTKTHSNCASCHGKDVAHAPIAKPDPTTTCATCHATESKTAHRGHSPCTTCHEPHSGNRVAKAATCTTSCHASKVAPTVLHANVIMQGGTPTKSGAPSSSACATCHRAHDHATGPNPPDPPSCRSCHTKLPNLHSASTHSKSDCKTCHTAHGPPKADRATCTSGNCHSDRTNHQPEAQTCKGCHFFRKQ